MNEDMDTLLEEIKATEKHLAELRKEYRERKTAGVRAAIEARTGERFTLEHVERIMKEEGMLKDV